MKQKASVCGVVGRGLRQEGRDEAGSCAEEGRREEGAPSRSPRAHDDDSEVARGDGRIRQGARHAMHARFHEAVADFKKAVELDPDFAVALSELGMTTPGAEGTDMFAKAGRSPPTFRAGEAFIEAHQAMRAGDGKSRQSNDSNARALAPGDLAPPTSSRTSRTIASTAPRPFAMLRPRGTLAPNERSAATTCSPTRSVDAQLGQSDRSGEEAGRAAAEGRRIHKTRSARFSSGPASSTIAEKSFLEATKLDPNYPAAWAGVALARGYRGDYKGALEAYDIVQTSAKQPGVKFEAMLDSRVDPARTRQAARRDDHARRARQRSGRAEVPLYAFARRIAPTCSRYRANTPTRRSGTRPRSAHQACGRRARGLSRLSHRRAAQRRAARQARARRRQARRGRRRGSQGMRTQAAQSSHAHPGLAAWGKSEDRRPRRGAVKVRAARADVSLRPRVRPARPVMPRAKTMYQQLVETPRGSPRASTSRRTRRSREVGLHTVHSRCHVAEPAMSSDLLSPLDEVRPRHPLCSVRVDRNVDGAVRALRRRVPR